jgi:polyisoprenyl-teichoic acid--peptidoglycan teichoic acid transferase
MEENRPPSDGRYRVRKPPPEGDGTEAPGKKRYWWRFGLASMVIVAVTAAATSTAVLLYLSSITHALTKTEPWQHEVHLRKVHPGEPETILIIGSDDRPSFGERYGRSDTSILLRLDAGKHLISVMSIPRDLKTAIPGHGTEKFNAAYSDGGPKLEIKVVEELTGLEVNHVVNVNFLGFVRAVDAIGCVYTDVDRRYYHSNADVVPGSAEEYSAIDIQPGYQKLCGKKALEYVRYRHTDTDIVRSARQQSFLSQARHQVSPLALITDEDGLIETLTEYTTSDITSADELIALLDLLYELKGAEVDQIHFPAELGPSYVYAKKGAIASAAKAFLGEAEGGEAKPSPAPKEMAPAKPAAHTKKHAKPHPRPRAGGDELVPATEAGEAEAAIVAHHLGGGFPVFYPTRLPPEAAFQESDPEEKIVDPRVYHLKDKDKERHAAYRMVGVFGPEYELNYLGVQGIQGWEEPPILEGSSEEKEIGGRNYLIYTDGGKIKLVAWHHGESTYWISNSLQQSLSNVQMMGIAESCRLLSPPGGASSASRAARG